MTGIEIMLVVVCIAAVVLAAISLALLLRMSRALEEQRLDGHERTEALERANGSLDAAQAVLSRIVVMVNSSATQLSTAATAEQQRYDGVVRAFDQTGQRVDDLRRDVATRLDRNQDAVDVRLEKMRETVDTQLSAMRVETGRQLDAMRVTVDEKLTNTLNDRLGASFKQVSDQLEAVYKGLGEMQSVAGGVRDLNRVLSNVKTRGMLGEVQLGAILADILSPDQYAENIATKPGSTERVEFAVKLPVEGGEPIWLPIDAKFPGDTYGHLRDAIDAGDSDAIFAARKALEQVIRQEAKDISEKYLSVPDTTNFGVMFLPFEGLYAEVVDTPGLIESLQRDYQVNVAGPSTMAAILNSLQMSYQTFAFQRRADEIQKVLSAVKAEFPKYQMELRRALRQIETAGRTVDGIINTRTNVIERKLRDVTVMEDDAEAAELLGLDVPVEEAESDQEK